VVKEGKKEGGVELVLWTLYAAPTPQHPHPILLSRNVTTEKAEIT